MPNTDPETMTTDQLADELRLAMQAQIHNRLVGFTEVHIAVMVRYAEELKMAMQKMPAPAYREMIARLDAELETARRFRASLG